MNIMIVGSFATVLLSLWLLNTGLLIALYAPMRKVLFSLNPAYASNVLLFLIALPMTFSLFCTSLLFLPFLENLFVAEHCHDNCGEHLPLLESAFIAWPGLFAMTLMLAVLLVKTWQNIHAVRRLSTQLKALSHGALNDASEKKERIENDIYKVLHTSTPLVFTIGFWKNTIYLSEGVREVCSKNELDIVFAHETAHVKRLDNLRVLLARLLLALMPKKFSSVLYDDLQWLIESACDAQAAKRYGALNVAETFIKLQRLVPKPSSMPFGVSSIYGSEIEFRINSLIEEQKFYTPSKSTTVFFSLMLLLLLVACVNPLHHFIEWLVVGL